MPTWKTVLLNSTTVAALALCPSLQQAIGDEQTPLAGKTVATVPVNSSTPAMVAIRELNGEVKVSKEGKTTLVILHYIPVPKSIWEKLGTLDTVEQVELENSQISDNDLMHIGKLKQLQVAAFYNNPITSAGLVHLSGLTNLQNLGLNQTKVDSKGIKHLTAMTKLEKLWLDNSLVDDEAIEELSKLKQLQHLGLRGTRMTPEGIAKLKQLMPNTAIQYTPAKPTAPPVNVIEAKENVPVQNLQPAIKRRLRGFGH